MVPIVYGTCDCRCSRQCTVCRLRAGCCWCCDLAGRDYKNADCEFSHHNVQQLAAGLPLCLGSACMHKGDETSLRKVPLAFSWWSDTIGRTVAVSAPCPCVSHPAFLRLARPNGACRHTGCTGACRHTDGTIRRAGYAEGSSDATTKLECNATASCASAQRTMY